MKKQSTARHTVKCSACDTTMPRAHWDTHRCLRSMTDEELRRHLEQSTARLQQRLNARH